MATTLRFPNRILPALLLFPCLAAAVSDPSEEEPRAAPTLAAEWDGVWAGPMKQIAMDGEAAEFRMELRVGPSPKDGEGARTWIIRYSGPTGAAPVRDYVLKPESGTARGFVVDERSGIVIDHFLGDRVLYAAFQVADSLVHVRYAVQDDRLDVEMVTYSTEKPRRTRFPDGSFQVDSFPARVVQRGVLERVEEGG